MTESYRDQLARQIFIEGFLRAGVDLDSAKARWKNPSFSSDREAAILEANEEMVWADAFEMVTLPKIKPEYL